MFISMGTAMMLGIALGRMQGHIRADLPARRVELTIPRLFSERATMCDRRIREKKGKRS